MIPQLVLYGALADAVATIRGRDETVKAQVEQLLADGNLDLEFTVHFYDSNVGDEGVYGEFFDATYRGCWDGCNGITTVHRAGWCPVNPEHADLDCMCGVPPEAWDDDDETEGVAVPDNPDWETMTGSQIVAHEFGDLVEEPF